MLKLYIPGINTSILPKKHDENIFSEKINELNYWIENHPHVIHLPNVKDSLFVKINGTILKKHKHLPQISLRELHNGMILPIYEVFFGARTADGNICIGYTSLRNYMPKNIKPMRNRNNITCGRQICISVILLQSDLEKWRI